MSHGPPLASNFFGYGAADEDDQPIINGDALAETNMAAAMAAGVQTPSQDDAAMMLYFQDPTPLFNSFDDMPNVLGAAAGGPLGAAAAAGSVFPPSFPSDFTTDGAAGGATNSLDADVDAGTVVTSNSSDFGSGPQPIAGFSQSNNTLTEFTRRKNWPAKVVEELRDLLQIIEPNGRIRFSSPVITEILGYTPEEAAGESLSDLVHPDDRAVFVSELNACIANATPLRMYLRLRKKDDSYAVLEMVGHAHIAASQFAPNPANQSPFCQAVFLMARPYPTKNAGLLDSFLEHKMENERLRRRVDDLRREEESESRDDNESHAQSMSQSQSRMSQSQLWRQGPRSEFAPSEAASVSVGGRSLPAGYFRGAAAVAQQQANSLSMASSVLPLGVTGALGGGGIGLEGGGGGIASIAAVAGFTDSNLHNHNAALTRENLEGIAAHRPDSLRDKMARYEGMPAPPSATAASTAGGSSTAGGAPTLKRPGAIGTATHADTIEMLTGLRYQEGERSKGLSTGNRSPRLVRGDAGIAFSINRDQRAGEKKKKIRLAEEYVCTDCGTLESPEWRKGPSGPKTLCNACGLRWAKKEKKEKKRATALVAGGASSPPTQNWG